MVISPKILVFDHEDRMVEFMVRKWEEIGKKAIAEKGYFTVALSGGKTPVRFYQKLAGWDGRPFWHRTHLFLVDERFLSFDDQDSNYGMLRETLFEKIPIPGGNIHPIPAEKGSLEISAEEYERDLKMFFKLSKGQHPVFDLILLGVGEEGHTASLFPGSEALSERIHSVAAFRLDESRHHRITLTLPVINHGEHVIFFVRGKNKAPILRKIINREDLSLPASMVQPKSGNLLFLIDREASSQLSL